jgi:hypothetical protein
VQRNGLNIRNDGILESVGKFYLANMVNADSEADSAVVAMVRCAWKKYRKLSPILTFKGASLKLKGQVYGSCVRSCMMYGSETWLMKKGHQCWRGQRCELLCGCVVPL